MSKKLAIIPEQYRQVDGLDPDRLRLVHWLSIQNPEITKNSLARLNDGEIAELAHVVLQLQMLLNSKKGEAAAEIINAADKALDEVEAQFKKKKQTRAAIKKTANKPWYKRLWGGITGSTRAEVANSVALNAESDKASVAAQKRLIESYKKDAEISVRLYKMQSRLIILDQFIHLEEQKSITYKLAKAIRLLLKGGNGKNQTEELITCAGATSLVAIE